MREMISLRKHSDSFSFEVELNRVEIQDQRHPNGSIPQRTTLFIHRVEPDVKIPQSFDPTFRWPSVLSALGEERVATFNINFPRLWPSKRRVQGTTRPRGMAIYARHISQGTRTAESETQGYEEGMRSTEPVISVGNCVITLSGAPLHPGEVFARRLG